MKTMNEYSFTISRIVKCQEKLKKVTIRKLIDIKWQLIIMEGKISK